VTGAEFDVDLGFYIEVNEDPKPGSKATATELKAAVRASLGRYDSSDHDATGLMPSKQRCERLSFVKDFHLDVPSYDIVVKKDSRWLATQSKGWENSDPKALHVWFIEKVEAPERFQIRRFICYLKAWCGLLYIKNEKAKPSSIMLTILATEVYLALSEAVTKGDEEEVFGAFVEAFIKRVNASDRVLNPVDRSENLNRLSERFQGFCRPGRAAQRNRKARHVVR